MTKENNFIGHEFIKYLFDTEYGITAKPITLESPMSNDILKQIHQVLGNLVQTFNIQHTYIDKNKLQTRILAAAVFAILSTTNRKKGYSPGQLIFCCDIILSIKHRVDRELIRHQKQTKINRDNTHENKHRVEYDYKVGDKVILANHTV